MSDRQRAFVEEYLVDLNAAAAARRAGYSAKTAHATDKLITPAVHAAIETALSDRRERTRVAADTVVAELAKIAFANMADYIGVEPDGSPRIDFTRLTRDAAAAIQSITVDYWRETYRPRKAGEGDHRPTPAKAGGRADGGGGEPPHGTPRRIRITLADKRAALVDLARHLGIEQARPEAPVNKTVVYRICMGPPPGAADPGHEDNLTDAQWLEKENRERLALGYEPYPPAANPD